MSNNNLISRVEGPSRRKFLHMATGAAVLPAAVGTGAAQEEISMRSRKVIDDFERGDLSPYKYDGRDAWNFDIHSGDYVYSGDHSLEVQTSYDGRAVVSDGGLNYYPERGDRIEWIQRFEGRHSWGSRYGTRWRISFYGEEGDAYTVSIHGQQTHEFRLSFVSENDREILDSEHVGDWGSYDGEWQRVEFDWDTEGDGYLRVDLYDEDDDRIADLEAHHSDGPVEVDKIRYHNVSDVDKWGQVYFDEFVANSEPSEESGDSDLRSLRDRKLSLADSIDNNGLGFMNDRQIAEPALERLIEEVSAGTLAESTASEAIERMELGERVADAVLAGAGPGSSDHLGLKTNISELTARNAVNPVLELLFAGISVVKAAQRIPFVSGAADRAARFIADLVADLVGRLSPTLEGLIRRRGKDAGYTILGEAESVAEDQGQEFTEEQFKEIRDDELIPFIEDGSGIIFHDFLFGEKYEFQGNPTEPVDEGVKRLVSRLSMEPSRAEFTSTKFDAKNAVDETLSDIEEIYETAHERLVDSLAASILSKIGILQLVLTVVAFLAGVTGVGVVPGAIAGIASTLVGLGVGIFLMVQWGVGATSILAARYRQQIGISQTINPV